MLMPWIMIHTIHKHVNYTYVLCVDAHSGKTTLAANLSDFLLVSVDLVIQGDYHKTAGSQMIRCCHERCMIHVFHIPYIRVCVTVMLITRQWKEKVIIVL